MYSLLKRSGAARRGTFTTVHGTVQTPGFMNVATAGAIKGAVSAYDLKELGCQVQLCNTYHLHLRPGDETVKALGGVRKFTGWQGPVLTDSGGFQVFSLAKLRNIREEGVTFASHIDGHKIFMGPEESMRIQSNLGSTIAMAFDECVENPAEYAYAKASCARTARWLERCQAEMARLNAREDTLNPRQMLFGINQGCTYQDLRVEHMKRIAAMDLDGYGIGGLAVGETAEEMYAVIEAIEPHMPQNKIRYLMGVGTPVNILEAVRRGVDLFDCVMPTRNARHGHAFTHAGCRNLMNAKYALDQAPLDEECGCPVCQRFTRAYLHHLFKAGEMLGMRLAVMHNLYFYNHLLEDIRKALDEDRFESFYQEKAAVLGRRI
ncbi:tRNA guanosine(34) transglycosylase Tgt [Oscillospiraceae bacterium 42-9]|jgi:queuine tRNA-ribosyltransferase|uniref:tRNA guanosine(34) transglycosylase Tgt n=1 Tax=Acutalibacter sp. TaxID=1918636 RepID=UPI00216F65C9|nr:tRNA guanosine(34) transglycosylase Tgt [Acutalibacter sp.]